MRTMKIISKKGCVVQALKNKEVDVILHVCNDRGVMGSGVALTVKTEIPEAYEAYRKSGHRLGTTTFAGRVVNMVAQHNYGYDGLRYLNYGALAECLIDIQDILIDLESIEGIEKLKIGVPYKMGAHRAGGDWKIISEMIEFIFGDMQVYSYAID